MSRRLVILTEIIAPYRIPVFNALARHEEIDLHVIFLAESDPKLRDWLVYKDEIRFSYQVLPSWRRRLAGHNLLLNRGLKKGAAAGGSGRHSVRRLQLSGLMAGDALGTQAPGPIYFVGRKHGAGHSQPQPVDRIPEKEIHEALQRFCCPREIVFAVRDELWDARRETFLLRPMRLTRNSLPSGRRRSVRTPRGTARLCNCRRDFSCLWEGWSGKKECLTCLRPMAN